MSDTAEGGTAPATHAEIIALWGDGPDFARAIGVGDVSARAYRRRGIPPKHWPRVVEAARLRGLAQVTFDLLAALAPGSSASSPPVEVQSSQAA